MGKREKLKIVISTKKNLVSSIKHGIRNFIGNPKYNLQYSVVVGNSKKNEDPIVEIIISGVASAIVGAAVRSFVDWMIKRRKQERGFGHVRYKTLGIARSEARYDLENVQGIEEYEELEARVDDWALLITLRDNAGRIHSYSISRSCALKSYNRS